MNSKISSHTLKRLPFYLNYLETLKKEGVENVSAGMIAKQLGLSEILVKKDLGLAVRTSGKPKVGHNLDTLISELRDFLGYDDTSTAVLVGAGHLGGALLAYNGFKAMNLEIAYAFDNNPKIVGKEINGILILNIDDLETTCQYENIELGIITTTADGAQDVCDKLVKAGIKAIWNFAPVSLKAPDDVLIQNENLASSLAVLSNKLVNKNK